MKLFFHRIYLTISLLILFPVVLNAQKNVENQDLLWLRYNLKLNIEDNWQLIQEVEERSYWFPWRQHQFLTRTLLTRKMGKGWNVGAAFTYFQQSIPYDPEERNYHNRTELRPQIEVVYKQILSENWNINHRYWSEFRFIEQESGNIAFTNNRSRYKLELSYSPHDKIHLKAFDEIFLNIGSKITYNVFDQNRYGFSIQYMPFEKLGVEVGYIKWFQQRASGDDFYNRDIVRFTIIHIINLNKK